MTFLLAYRIVSGVQAKVPHALDPLPVARMAELADAQDLKSCDRKVVRVRLPLRAFPIGIGISCV